MEAPRQCPACVSDFCNSRSGSVALVFGLTLPVLLCAVGMAVDYGNWLRQGTLLQVASDAAALAAAKELAVATHHGKDRLKAVAQAIVEAKFGSARSAGVVVATTVRDKTIVEVVVSQPRQDHFTGLFNIAPGTLSKRAVATSSGERKLCVIALDEASRETIYLKSNSWLMAKDCDVYSNSKDARGVYLDNGIRVTADLTCSAGGFDGQGRTDGKRLTDCPRISDPLSERAAPSVGPCKYTNHAVIDQGSSGARHKLTPGTYCGGLFIGGHSVVELAPGEYVIKDGPLVFDSNADIKGNHVGFFLVGSTATLQFLGNARVDLTAPKDGSLAGLLFFEDRSAPLLREHQIKTNFANNMTGTIYLSRGRFVVDATNDIAQQSAYTVIVSRQLWLTRWPKLTLNTMYSKSDVPVPKGLGPLGGNARLVE
jgi:Flp pilus assembly protein TadG